VIHCWNMTKEELKKIKGSDDVMVLDIREAEELEAEPPVGGAVHMPMGKVFTEAAKGNIPKDKKVISICKTGGRCQVLTDALKERGFNADYVEGGLEALKEEE